MEIVTIVPRFRAARRQKQTFARDIYHGEG
jgi:hypothetical protein